MKPPAALIYAENIPSAFFDDFANEIADQRHAVEITSRPASGPFASLEWLLPTTVALWIGKSYFDAFLKEAGKDHYHALKSATGKLAARLSLVKATLIGTRSKATAHPIYSVTFSITSETEEGVRFKLLIPAELAEEDASSTAQVLLDFLKEYQTGELNNTIRLMISNAPRVGNSVLISYDSSKQTLVLLDALARTATPATAEQRD